MNAIRTIQNVAGPTLTIAVPPEFAGRQVEVEVRVVPTPQPWGEGLRRCAGGLANDPEWDSVMDEVYQARKVERPSRTVDE